MTTISQAAVEHKVKYVGSDWCDICKHEKKDCVEVTTGFFTSITMCDGCWSAVGKLFDPKISGEVERRYHDW